MNMIRPAVTIFILTALFCTTALAQPSCNPFGRDARGMSVDDDSDGLIEICTLQGLDAIRYSLGGVGYKANPSATTATTGCPQSGCNGYELTKDLDFDDESYSYPTTAGWSPIGYYTSSDDNEPFASIFEGNARAIYNLMIERSTSSYVGLFGYVKGDGAEIKNIGLFSVAVRGDDDVGGLVGQNHGTITNGYATGMITGNDRVGGLVGQNHGAIRNSYVAGVVVRGNDRVGGLVGENTGGIIINSYSAGRVSGRNSVGGLIGRHGGTITNSYTAGRVSGSKWVGGLVGYSFRPVKDSYATGRVSGGRSVGGLVGENDGAITNSYSTGEVSSSHSSSRGGLVGNFAFGEGATASYWDTVTSKQQASSQGTGKTTSELQMPTTNTGIYATWDLSSWDFGTSSEYPRLRYVAGSDTANPACGRSGLPDCGDRLPHLGPVRLRFKLFLEGALQ